MARTSMTQLISLVRDLIGDPAGTEQVFTDDQIERTLDLYRFEFANHVLKLSPLGEETRTIWFSSWKYWEGDTQLYTSQGALTPSARNDLQGQWEFATAQSAVFARGKVYDPYAAAADLLLIWAGKAATEFDFSADGSSFHRSQKREGLLRLAAEYRKQQMILSIDQVRDDI